jgi:hypothetical protein
VVAFPSKIGEKVRRHGIDPEDLACQAVEFRSYFVDNEDALMAFEQKIDINENSENWAPKGQIISTHVCCLVLAFL